MKKPKLSQSNQGFTFIEVLVGILMATVFVLIVTEGIVVATVFRVKAQRQSEALNAIQQDLENIKFEAAKDLTATATCDNATTRTTGYGKALLTALVPASVNSSFTEQTTEDLILLKKPHTMTRTLTVYDQTPFKILQVNYEVSPTEGGSIIATYSTEVIPDEAFECED